MKLMVDCMPLASGGGVQVAIAFLEGLRQQDEIDWIAAIPAGIFANLPTEFHHENLIGRFVPMAKTGLPDVLSAKYKLKRIERRWRPDIVFTVFGPAYFKATVPHLVGFALGNLIYGSAANWTRGQLLSDLKNSWRRRTIKRSDYIVVETSTVKLRLAERFKMKIENIFVVGNSVNPYLDKFSASALSNVQPFRILVPATYYPHKNLEFVTAVATEMRRLSNDVQFQFLLTLDKAGEPWKRIRDAAQAAGVADEITTLGSLQFDQLAAEYNSCSAVFLPTLCESSTAVFPEAFHFGRPLVTSDMDFARELCGDAGLYIPPFDANVTAYTLLQLLTDKALAKNLIRHGKAQLANAYPDATKKFTAQVDLLKYCLKRGKKDNE